MTKFITRLIFVGLLAGVIAGAPVRVLAEDKPAAEKKEPHKGEKKKGVAPFNGKLAAVDKLAKTIKVGERTFQITSETKLFKGDKPGTLDDAMVGEAVSGGVRTADDGKLVATMVRFGHKSEAGAGTKKKKEAPSK